LPLLAGGRVGRGGWAEHHVQEPLERIAVRAAGGVVDEDRA
jgi:hypothetical protein